MEGYLGFVGWFIVMMGMIPIHPVLAAGHTKMGTKLSYPDERLPGTASTIVEAATRLLKNALV